MLYFQNWALMVDGYTSNNGILVVESMQGNHIRLMRSAIAYVQNHLFKGAWSLKLCLDCWLVNE
jgi:hypothetical protein